MQAEGLRGPLCWAVQMVTCTCTCMPGDSARIESAPAPPSLTESGGAGGSDSLAGGTLTCLQWHRGDVLCVFGCLWGTIYDMYAKECTFTQCRFHKFRGDGRQYARQHARSRMPNTPILYYYSWSDIDPCRHICHHRRVLFSRQKL